MCADGRSFFPSSQPSLTLNVTALSVVTDDSDDIIGCVCPRCLKFWAVNKVPKKRKQKYTIPAWDDPVEGLAAHLRAQTCDAVDKREKKLGFEGNREIKSSGVKRMTSLARVVRLFRAPLPL